MQLPKLPDISSYPIIDLRSCHDCRTSFGQISPLKSKMFSVKCTRIDLRLCLESLTSPTLTIITRITCDHTLNTPDLLSIIQSVPPSFQTNNSRDIRYMIWSWIWSLNLCTLWTCNKIFMICRPCWQPSSRLDVNVFLKITLSAITRVIAESVQCIDNGGISLSAWHCPDILISWQ